VEALLIWSLLANLRKRRRAEKSLLESREALSDMSQRLIKAQEHERSGIGLELHDDINQRLAAVRLQLNLLERSFPTSTGVMRDGLTKAQTHIAELVNDIQAMSHRLYSPNLKYVGLAQAAEALCRDFAVAQPIAIDFYSDGVSKDLPEEICLCLFRVLQEALQNVAKHSKARRGEVVLIGGPDTIELRVSDEGNGFQPERVLVGASLGLPSMKQRLKLVNGQVSIESEPGRGTVIRARVPLQAKKEPAHSG